ncbi:MAG: hypothetical protein H0W74_06625 [Sphingosinicella sp.]|nr:hypothetical protein [Sphingosinicella sp.]
MQSAIEALAQDSAQYATANGVSLTEAMRRLRAQESSVAATDSIQEVYRERLAGITIEHRPDFRIVVLLTGTDPVPDRTIFAGGMHVPILFRTGAPATREQIVAAIRQHQAAIKAALPAQGMGVDQRTGELVMMVSAPAAARYGVSSMEEKLKALAGVPARIRVLDRPDVNSNIEGGARLVGVDPANGKRYSCTAGFVVTDGARTGIVTAAHCPDSLTYYDPAGERIKLDFGGQWGWSYQDVQLHVTERAQQPLFYADTGKSVLRPVTSSRARNSTRAGEAICRRGETSGYSCSEVELTDYAPPGDLCGGPCDAVWVTVTGPSCKSGDSGGPIFSGTIAFGIVKGGNYSRDGTCNFYYYMSMDYLPQGWSLLRG